MTRDKVGLEFAAQRMRPPVTAFKHQAMGVQRADNFEISGERLLCESVVRAQPGIDEVIPGEFIIISDGGIDVLLGGPDKPLVTLVCNHECRETAGEKDDRKHPVLLRAGVDAVAMRIVHFERKNTFYSGERIEEFHPVEVN